MRTLDGTTIVVASHNAGKIREIRRPDRRRSASRRKSAADLGLPEPDETGTTFEENAYDQGARRGQRDRPAGAVGRFRPRASMRSTARPASTPPTGPSAPTAAAISPWRCSRIEDGAAGGRRDRRRRSAPAASSRCSASPGRTARPNIPRRGRGHAGLAAARRHAASATIRCSCRTATTTPSAR